MSWSWEQRGRSRRVVAILLGAWAAIAGLWLVLRVRPWIVAPLLAATLPALRDVVADRRLRLEVDPGAMRWRSGRRRGEVALDPGTRVSLRRRFDGGLRIVVTTPEGRETRLPPELAPPLEPLETALSHSPAEIRRDPFRLF